MATSATGTNFLDLPRWEIDSALIHQLHTGRSNTTRTNYCQLLGITPWEGPSVGSQQLNAVNNPPIVDQADVQRAGLRMYTAQVGAKVVFTDSTIGENPGTVWTKLMADVMFGSHLKYTGTATLRGIQAPICEGDNAVVDGVIYHIERVMHQGSIDVMGMKDFTTTLQLSSGISVESDKTDLVTVYPDLNTNGQDFTNGENVVVKPTEDLFGTNKGE